LSKIKKTATGSTVRHTSNNSVYSVEIGLPSTVNEQKAITQALRDVDDLISSLERFIAKKRNIKQGAMQELLTGKKRLPGFSGEWGVKKLGEIAEIDPDNLASSTNPEYSFMYISLEDVDNGTLKNITEMTFQTAPSRARRIVKKDDILISTVRPNLKSHLRIRGESQDWICSTGFAVLRCKNHIAIPGFVFNHLFSFIIGKQIDALITGSNYPAIKSKDVKSLQIPLPISIKEQTAIAQVLGDMDMEIESLEKKRDKYKSIKQGMMQELLTGRTRLI
jgi:type I restriction enzyme S subunit